MTKIEPRIATQADLFQVLTRQVAESAIKAGWIKPCCVRPGGRGKKLFAVEDIRRCEERILNGEYPK